MISKEKVLKIIRDFYAAQVAEKNKEKTGVAIKDFQWCEEKKTLLNYLKHLDKEEFIDLCALIDYGKEAYQQNAECTNFNEFKFMREGVVCNETSALDLLKISQFGIYLNKATKLYDVERFEF